jgi:hypothetical protein
VRLDGAVESAVRLGSRMRSPTWSRPVDPREAGPRDLRPVILRVDGRADRRRDDVPGSRPCRAAPGRHGRAPVRAHGLRPAREPRRRGVEDHAGLESPTVSPLRDSDWVAVRVMVPRSRPTTSWTSCTHSAPRDPGPVRSTPPHMTVADEGHPVPRCRGGPGGPRASTSSILRDAGDPVELARRYYEQGGRRGDVP